MAHGRGFRPRRSTSKRLTAWSLGPQADLTSLSGTTPVIWTSGVVLTAAGEDTIVRIRGSCEIFLTAATAQADGFAGALGIGIVTSQAFAAAVASVPTPMTELDWDGWMWHQFFHVHAGGIIDGSVAGDQDQVNAVAAAVRFDIDSKAMRKQNDQETLMGVIEMGTETGTASARFAADTRILVKLP